MAPSKKTVSGKGAKKVGPKQPHSTLTRKDVSQEVALKDDGRARPQPQSAIGCGTALLERRKPPRKSVPDLEAPSLRTKDLAPFLKPGVAEVNDDGKACKTHCTEDVAKSSEETCTEGLETMNLGGQHSGGQSNLVTLTQRPPTLMYSPSVALTKSKEATPRQQHTKKQSSLKSTFRKKGGRHPEAAAAPSSPVSERRMSIGMPVPNLEGREKDMSSHYKDVAKDKRVWDVTESTEEESVRGWNKKSFPSGCVEGLVLDEVEAERVAVKRVDENTWTSNPSTIPFLEKDVPNLLQSQVLYKKDKNASSKEDFKEMLQANLLSNREFQDKARYMYIFGPKKYFQLRVEDMVNSEPESCTIVRPLEEEGVSKCLKRMVRMNFSKQILTVMPNTRKRPTNWMECVTAGKFRIINGQHTWKAAERILQRTNVDVDDEAIVERARHWTCEVVWSAKPDHLHALSFKCNEGNEELPFLSTLVGTIRHCRSLWIQKGKPEQVRKNTNLKPGSEAEKKFLAYQDFVRLCTESYMGTGVARQDGKKKPTVFDFSKLGEKLIFMGSDLTWTKWNNCFAAIENGDLYDIDSGCMFKERMSTEKEDENDKPVLVGTMLRPMAGFHDIYVRQLALALMKNPPKACLMKPKSWSRTQGVLEWCTRKKFKSYLCKLLSIACTPYDIPHKQFMTDHDVVKPKTWKEFKKAAHVNGMHFDAMIAEADPSFINQKILRKNSDAPIPEGLTRMTNAVVMNHERYEDVMSAVDAVGFLYCEERLAFYGDLCKREGGEDIVYEGRAAQLRDCEAGIIDFRLFPGDPECISTRKTNESLIDSMYELGKFSSKFIEASIKTWMLIFFHSMKDTVESIVRKYFPKHILKRGGKYVRAQGEAKFGVTWVWYLQNPSTKRRPQQFADFSAELREIGPQEDILTVDNTPLEHRYKKRTEYRNEQRFVQDIIELRMELYLRFIDTFTHFQACVMLVFAGSKAVAACTSLGRSSVSAITLELYEKAHSEVVDFGAAMWPEFYVPTLNYTYKSCLDNPNVKIIPRVVQQDSHAVEEETSTGLNGGNNEEDLPHNAEDEEQYNNIEASDLGGGSQVLASAACNASTLLASSPIVVSPATSSQLNAGATLEMSVDDESEKEEPLVDKRQAKRASGSGPKSCGRTALVCNEVIRNGLRNSVHDIAGLQQLSNEGSNEGSDEASDEGRQSESDDEILNSSSGTSTESDSDDSNVQVHEKEHENDEGTRMMTHTNTLGPISGDSKINRIRCPEDILACTVSSVVLAMGDNASLGENRIRNGRSQPIAFSTTVSNVPGVISVSGVHDIIVLEPVPTNEGVENSNKKAQQVCTVLSSMVEGSLPSVGHDSAHFELTEAVDPIWNGCSKLANVDIALANKAKRIIVGLGKDLTHVEGGTTTKCSQMDVERHEVCVPACLSSADTEIMAELEIARSKIENQNNLLREQEERLKSLQSKVDESKAKEVQVIDPDDNNEEILEEACFMSTVPGVVSFNTVHDITGLEPVPKTAGIFNGNKNAPEVCTILSSMVEGPLAIVEHESAHLESTTVVDPDWNSCSKQMDLRMELCTIIGDLPNVGDDLVNVEEGPAADCTQMDVDGQEICTATFPSSADNEGMSELEIARAKIEKQNHLLQQQEEKLKLLQNKVDKSNMNQMQVIDLDDIDDEILEERCSVDAQLLEDHKKYRSKCQEVLEDSKAEVKPTYADHMEKALLATRKRIREQVEETILVSREKKARRQKKKAEQEAMNKALRLSMKKQEEAMAILIYKVASMDGSQNGSETFVSGMSTVPMAVLHLPSDEGGTQDQQGTLMSSTVVCSATQSSGGATISITPSDVDLGITNPLEKSSTTTTSNMEIDGILYRVEPLPEKQSYVVFYSIPSCEEDYYYSNKRVT